MIIPKQLKSTNNIKFIGIPVSFIAAVATGLLLVLFGSFFGLGQFMLFNFSFNSFKTVLYLIINFSSSYLSSYLILFL